MSTNAEAVNYAAEEKSAVNGAVVALGRLLFSANFLMNHGAKGTYDDHLRNHRQHTTGSVL